MIPREDNRPAWIDTLERAHEAGWRPGMTAPTFNAWAQALPATLQSEVLAVLKPAEPMQWRRRRQEAAGVQRARGEHRAYDPARAAARADLNLRGYDID